jgi:hypothetical protein
VVYEAEMVPQSELSHSIPVPIKSVVKVDEDTIAEAKKLYGEDVADELARLPPGVAREVLEAIKMIMDRKVYKIRWDILTRAMEIIEKKKQTVSIPDRVVNVRREISRIITEHNIPIDEDKVFSLALRYRHLWSGRHTSVVAKIFISIYCLNCCDEGHQVMRAIVSPKLIRVIHSLTRVVEVEEC